MNPQVAEKVNALADKAHDFFEEVKKSDAFKALVTEMKNIGQDPSEFISLGLELKLFNTQKEGQLDIYSSGMQSNGEGEPSPYQGGETFEKFLLHGDIQVVPNGKCPQCYQAWDFKDMSPSCSNCAIELGPKLKYLIDSDHCPNCEGGTVTRSQPSCDKCDYVADPKRVTWG